jgi:hypothetical protein
MFSPVVIEIPESEVCPYLECHELKRFPYLEEKSCIREGSFGAMKKLEIMSDYLHPTMRKRMKPYSTNEKVHPCQLHLCIECFADAPNSYYLR